MRWTPGNVSNNIEDRRGRGGMAMGGLGVGGGIIGLILYLIFGGGGGGNGGGVQIPDGTTSQTANGAVQETPEEHRLVLFVSSVLDSTQAVWGKILPQQENKQYRDAKLVLFRDMDESACGMAQSATGPFYCPVDEKVYIDLAFYDELRRKFGAPGDMAQAYVIAHELGHHVQKILGISDQVHQMQQNRPSMANELSVRLELQADCFAGVWASQEKNIIEQGDIDEALNAAASVGDDHIQQMSGRAVSPESWTHGSSAQRSSWFKRGYSAGRTDACDTFGGR